MRTRYTNIALLLACKERVKKRLAKAQLLNDGVIINLEAIQQIKQLKSYGRRLIRLKTKLIYIGNSIKAIKSDMNITEAIANIHQVDVEKVNKIYSRLIALEKKKIEKKKRKRKILVGTNFKPSSHALNNKPLKKKRTITEIDFEDDWLTNRSIYKPIYVGRMYN